MTGHGEVLGISIPRVNLLGVQVTARALLNSAEHERRSVLGLGAVTDPALLDRLLDLPAGYPCRDPALWAETSAALPGIVDRSADRCTVTRLLEPPLVVDDVIVPAAGPGTTGRPGREPVRQLHPPMCPGPENGCAGHRGAGSQAIRSRVAGLARTGDPASRAARLDDSGRVGVAASGEDIPPVAAAGRQETLAPGGTGETRRPRQWQGCWGLRAGRAGLRLASRVDRNTRSSSAGLRWLPESVSGDGVSTAVPAPGDGRGFGILDELAVSGVVPGASDQDR